MKGHGNLVCLRNNVIIRDHKPVLAYDKTRTERCRSPLRRSPLLTIEKFLKKILKRRPLGETWHLRTIFIRRFLNLSCGDIYNGWQQSSAKSAKPSGTPRAVRCDVVKKYTYHQNKKGRIRFRPSIVAPIVQIAPAERYRQMETNQHSSTTINKTYTQFLTNQIIPTPQIAAKKPEFLREELGTRSMRCANLRMLSGKRAYKHLR